ncbi:MAG: extracellular solute-binding protein family 1 [Paenibacillus sp.]|nr:extracellular solute-binding protein family 1 [Paenibacillus sp.]
MSMRTRKRKTMTSAIVLTGMVAILSACGSGQPNNTAGGEGKDSDEVANHKVELTLYSRSADSQESFDQRFGNAIRKKFPNYTIKYMMHQKGSEIDNLILAGTPIDIVWDSIGLMFGSVLKPNLQFDMSELVEKNKIDMTRFEPTITDAMKQISNGGVYGLPVMNNNLILWYNKDIFERFGIPYPKDGMTWEEAAELSKRLTRADGGSQYFGLINSPLHYLRMNQLSLPFLTPDGKTTLANPKFQDILNVVFKAPGDVTAFKDAYREKGNFGYTTNSFLKDQDTAMQLWPSSMHLVWPEEISKLNWDVSTIPVFKEMPGVGSQAYPTYFFITSISKHKDEAMEVMKYLISDEHQTALSKMGVMPVVNDDKIKKMFNQETRFADKNFYNALFKLKLAPIPTKTIYDDISINALRAESDNVIRGRTDVNTALRNAEEKAAKGLEAEYKK